MEVDQVLRMIDYKTEELDPIFKAKIHKIVQKRLKMERDLLKNTIYIKYISYKADVPTIYLLLKNSHSSVSKHFWGYLTLYPLSCPFKNQSTSGPTHTQNSNNGIGSFVDPTLFIILGAMALMFIVMCVVLQLFAK